MWHAGKAIWKGYSPNQRFLGVALLSWGEVKKDTDGRFKTWNDEILSKNEVYWRVSNNGTNALYYWDGATPEQMASLTKIALWAAECGLPIDNICGHDECALPPGRKSDPGGVLPMPMMEFRKSLKTDFEKTGPVA